MIGWCSRCGFRVVTDDAGHLWDQLWSHLCTPPKPRHWWQPIEEWA